MRFSMMKPSRIALLASFLVVGNTRSDVNEMTYRDGKLRKKDWGFLPG